jgi:Rod binding domain-containing protein
MDAIPSDPTPPPPPDPAEREMTRLRNAARDFESLVLETMLREMKAGVPGGDDGSDPASGTLDSFGVQALSGVMARSGGFGLADVLVDAMEAQVRALAGKNEDGA